MNKFNIALMMVIIGLLPLLSFINNENKQQQRWWQRKTEKQPPEVIETLYDNVGHKIAIEFKKGREHNHPLMAFWIEDTAGNYIQSLYVAQSIAKGYFRHGDASSGRWEPGPLRRPAALPYWGHKRGIKAPDGYYLPTQDDPMPDALTGATPKGDFIIYANIESKKPEIFNVLMEINQSWDWNRYWHNNKFPDCPYYKTSSQPALVYKTTIDLNNLQDKYEMQVIGHSHWAGKTGELFKNLDTFTTALKITEKVIIKVERNSD